MLLTIAIPLYNEVRGVKTLIDKTYALFPTYEIIIVDDGSTFPKTRTILNDVTKKYPNITLLANKINSGKGYSIKKAFRKGRGKYFVVLDSDGELDPRDISKLMQQMRKNGTRFVNGTRVMKSIPTSNTNRITRLAKKCLGILIFAFYRKRVQDVLSAYKLLHRSDYEDFAWRSKRFGLETELLLHAFRKGIKIAEVDISYTPRTFKEGKKINMIDGIEIVKMIMRYRFFVK